MITISYKNVISDAYKSAQLHSWRKAGKNKTKPTWPSLLFRHRIEGITKTHLQLGELYMYGVFTMPR